MDENERWQRWSLFVVNEVRREERFSLISFNKTVVVNEWELFERNSSEFEFIWDDFVEFGCLTKRLFFYKKNENFLDQKIFENEENLLFCN